jgi:hypothetical protein
MRATQPLFEIHVRDSDGKDAPLTQAGRKELQFFAEKFMNFPAGGTVVEKYDLTRWFVLEPKKRYKVSVSRSYQTGHGDGWSSVDVNDVEFHVGKVPDPFNDTDGI